LGAAGKVKKFLVAIIAGEGPTLGPGTSPLALLGPGISLAAQAAKSATNGFGKGARLEHHRAGGTHHLDNFNSSRALEDTAIAGDAIPEILLLIAF
jgi:hypothetical protein